MFIVLSNRNVLVNGADEAQSATDVASEVTVEIAPLAWVVLVLWSSWLALLVNSAAFFVAGSYPCSLRMVTIEL